MPDCPDHDTLHQLLLGQIAEPESELLSEHLEQCPHCWAAVHALEAEDAVVRAARAPDPTPVADTDRQVLHALLGRVRDLPQQAAGTDASRWGHDTMPDGASIHPLSDSLAPPGYEVLGEIGQGGMGIVYKARQVKLNRLVALKWMQTRGRARPEVLGRFRREAEAIARLSHPHIVQIYEVGEQSGQPYLALEYVDGGSLAEQLADQPLVPVAAAALLETLARAIHHAHEHGIVHRDLKPANILLMVEGGGGRVEGNAPPSTLHFPPSTLHPKITDFGLAKLLDEDAVQTQTGDVIGTPGYMAPEQATGRAQDIGMAADIYALGALLYEALTGRPPFKGATPLDTLEQVRSQEPVPPSRLQPKVPRDLQTICLRCLEKEPHRRYATARELADDLHRYLQGEPIHARPVGPIERLCKWARRYPARAALVLVLGCTAAGAIVGMVLHNASLRAQVQRADDAAADAQRQQQRADTNYREAQALLGRLRDQLLALRSQSPEVTELRVGQLEEIAAYYHGLLDREDNPSPTLRADAARGDLGVGLNEFLRGRYRQAEKHLHNAVALYEPLTAEFPEHVDYAAALAQAWEALGLGAGSQQYAQQAVDCQRRALAIRKRLAELHPNDLGVIGDLEESQNHLAAAYQTAGQADKAEAHYREAVALLERFSKTDPNRAYDLAIISINLGDIYTQTGRTELARKTFESADAILRPGYKAKPHNPLTVVPLVNLDVDWGNFLRTTGRLKEALQRHEEAVRLLKDYLKIDPGYGPARGARYQAYGALAETYEALGRYKDAVPDWDKVVELAPTAAERRQWRFHRAATLARAGSHIRAVAEAHALVGLNKPGGLDLYNLACVCALCIEPARRDGQLRPAERARLAEDYAAQALAFLRQAERQRFFKLPANRTQLEKDSDLQTLRERSDFQVWLTTLKAAR